MFLGVNHLLDLVKSQNLVENLSERELTNPEGCGFDLRIAEAYTIEGEGYLGVTDRQTCPIKSVISISPNIHSSPIPKGRTGGVKSHPPAKNSTPTLTIKPNDFYLVRTIEKVNMPDNLVGIFKPRTTLQRMGLFLRTAQVAPGYSGELTFALKNAGPATIKLELGARIVHLMFAQVKGKTALYRGQWQGGRVTTTAKETQV